MEPCLAKHAPYALRALLIRFELAIELIAFSFLAKFILFRMVGGRKALENGRFGYSFPQ